MEFGIAFANVSRFGSAEGARTLARAAEDAGFESLWTVEHVVVPQGYASEYPYDRSGRMPGRESAPVPDPLIWLTWVAACTSSLKVGTGILILPERNPVVLAKEAATLARLSGDRFVLGVGAGWLAEEFDAIGVPFAERGPRLEDHIGALRALWSGSPASFEGPFTSFADVFCEPSPPGGTIPIVIGGHSPVAARRAGRLGDGFFPGRGSLQQLRELFDITRQAALDAGRDPDAIELTAPADASLFADPLTAIKEYEDMGVSRLVIPPLTFDLTQIEAALGRFGDEVIARVR
jgi:probable F420-dependent oxidoreductase